MLSDKSKNFDKKKVTQIKASQIRVTQIRGTEISSNHRELHGANFSVSYVFMKSVVEMSCSEKNSLQSNFFDV